jgi:hypothetical protein
MRHKPVASKTIFDKSEAKWSRDFYFAALARTTLSELLYHVLVAEGAAIQIAAPAKGRDDRPSTQVVAG